MKKITLIFALIILFNTNIFSQKNNFNYEQPNYNIGIELGPSMNNYTKGDKPGGFDSKYHEYKLGYSIGLIYQYNLNPHFSIRTNLDYERKIVALSSEWYNPLINENELEPMQYLYNYITIPLLAKYNINFKKSRFFIDAGPYLNLFLMNEYKSEYLDHLFIQKNTKDFRRFVLGMAAGFGTNIPIGKRFDMSFEARDNYGLTRICKCTDSPDNGKSRTSINSILFLYSIAYHIKSKKK